MGLCPETNVFNAVFQSSDTQTMNATIESETKLNPSGTRPKSHS